MALNEGEPADVLLEEFLGDGRNEPIEPKDLRDGDDVLVDCDDIDWSFFRIVLLLRTWCRTLSRAVSTRRTLPTVFMIGLF